MPINKSQSTKRIPLNLKGLTDSEKDQAKKEVGEIIVQGINDELDSSRSPVAGGRFQKKKADGSNSELFEFGDMRSQITFEEGERDEIMVGIFEDAPTVEKLKSFNHNTGDTLPQRRFIAAPNQKFKANIMNKANDAVKKIKRESEEIDSLVNQILDDI
jgi:hypothetical protein